MKRLFALALMWLLGTACSANDPGKSSGSAGNLPPPTPGHGDQQGDRPNEPPGDKLGGQPGVPPPDSPGIGTSGLFLNLPSTPVQGKSLQLYALLSENQSYRILLVFEGSECKDLNSAGWLQADTVELQFPKDGKYLLCSQFKKGDSVSPVSTFSLIKVTPPAKELNILAPLEKQAARQFNVSWNALGEGYEFEITVGRDLGCSNSVFSTTTAATSLDVKVDLDGTYYICLLGRSGTGSVVAAGNYNLPVIVDTSPKWNPGIANLRVNSKTTTSFLVAWDHPGDVYVLKQWISYRRADQAGLTCVDGEKVDVDRIATVANVTNLQPETEYALRYCYHTRSSSENTVLEVKQEAAVTAKTLIEPPEALGDITVSQNIDNPDQIVELSWNPVTRAAKYLINYSITTDPAPVACDLGSGLLTENTTYVFEGLLPDRYLNYSVCPANANDQPDLGQGTADSVYVYSPRAPIAVNVSVSDITTHTARLAWNIDRSKTSEVFVSTNANCTTKNWLTSENQVFLHELSPAKDYSVYVCSRSLGRNTLLSKSEAVDLRALSIGDFPTFGVYCPSPTYGPFGMAYLQWRGPPRTTFWYYLVDVTAAVPACSSLTGKTSLTAETLAISKNGYADYRTTTELYLGYKRSTDRIVKVCHSNSDVGSWKVVYARGEYPSCGTQGSAVLPQISLSSLPAVTEATKTNYQISGTCSPADSPIKIVGGVSANTMCSSSQTWSATVDLSGASSSFIYFSAVIEGSLVNSVGGVINNGLTP